VNAQQIQVTWERIIDPIDRRKTVWWRGTWPGSGPAYLSVAFRGGVFVWAARRRPGPDHIAVTGHAVRLVAARRRAEKARPALD
jgi:hypothetical protein